MNVGTEVGFAVRDVTGLTSESAGQSVMIGGETIVYVLPSQYLTEISSRLVVP